MWMFPLHYFQWTTVLSACINEWLPLWKTCYCLYSNDGIIRKEKYILVRGLPVAMTQGLLGLIVHKSRVTEAWKDKIYDVRESVRALKIICIFFLIHSCVAVLEGIQSFGC